MSEAKLYTHGVALKSVAPKDCVERVISVAYSQDYDKYAITFETKWTEDTEVVETKLTLSNSGISLLFDAIQRLLLDREEYRLPTKENKHE